MDSLNYYIKIQIHISYYPERKIHRIHLSPKLGSSVGLDQICFFFYPFCFSFLLKFSTYFAFIVPILLLITLILLLMMKSCCINLLHLYPLLPS